MNGSDRAVLLVIKFTIYGITAAMTAIGLLRLPHWDGLWLIASAQLPMRRMWTAPSGVVR
jgi:hypothetical protein